MRSLEKPRKICNFWVPRFIKCIGCNITRIRWLCKLFSSSKRQSNYFNMRRREKDKRANVWGAFFDAFSNYAYERNTWIALIVINYDKEFPLCVQVLYVQNTIYARCRKRSSLRPWAWCFGFCGARMAPCFFTCTIYTLCYMSRVLSSEHISTRAVAWGLAC